MRKIALQISQATSEQGRAAREIIKSAQSTSSIAAQVRRATVEQANGATQITSAVDSMRRGVASIARSVSEMAAAVASALAELYDRYDARFGEGEYVADLVRRSVDARAAAALVGAVSGASPEDLPRLARVLGWLEGEEVERALTRLIGEPSARSEVVLAVARHGERVTDLVLEQLDAGDFDTRKAWCLGGHHA